MSDEHEVLTQYPADAESIIAAYRTENAALRAEVERLTAARDEAVADARGIAETNLHAQAYIDGQKLASEALRAEVERLTKERLWVNAQAHPVDQVADLVRKIIKDRDEAMRARCEGIAQSAADNTGCPECIATAAAIVALKACPEPVEGEG